MLQRRHWRALLNTLILYPRPFANLARYAFGVGRYPYVCRVRTPTGEVAPTLFSPDDMLTMNEVFCRMDYFADREIRTAVDIGSNIGISALYFLTRNDHCHSYLFEPDPRNVDRLRQNLSHFTDRYRLQTCAVSDFNGDVSFGMESTGRYGAIDLELESEIVVRCREINDVLQEILGEREVIDVLKLDIEGHEIRVLEAIRPEFLRRTRHIYFEGAEYRQPFHTDLFERSRRGGCDHLWLREEPRTPLTSHGPAPRSS